MAKKLYGSYKINTFGPKQWIHMQGTSHFFWVVRGITLVPRGNPGTKFQPTWQFNFLDEICLKKAFLVENWKKGKAAFYSAYQISLQISLSTKFLPKLTILTFLTKFFPKNYVQSKRKKVNSTNELFIFCIQGISEWKQKKWTLPLNSAYSNYSSLTNFSLNR